MALVSSDWTVVDDSLVVDCVDASVVLVDPFSVVLLSELEVVDCVELSVFSDSVEVDPVVDVDVEFSVVEFDVDELEGDEVEFDELEVVSVVDAAVVDDDDDDDELCVDDSGFAVVDSLDDVELPSDVVDVLLVDDESPEAVVDGALVDAVDELFPLALPSESGFDVPLVAVSVLPLAVGEGAGGK